MWRTGLLREASEGDTGGPCKGLWAIAQDQEPQVWLLVGPCLCSESFPET